MPTGFQHNPHFFSAHLELTVELLRFLAVPQFPLVPFTTVRIDKRNLLEARVIVTTYNDHVGSFLPSLGWLAPPKFTRAWEPTLLWNHFASNSQAVKLLTTVTSELLVRTKPLARRTLARVRCRRLKRWPELWS